MRNTVSQIIFSLLLISAAMIFSGGCSNNTSTATDPNEDSSCVQCISAIADSLRSENNALFFFWPYHDSIVEEIWSKGDNSKHLNALIVDSTISDTFRLRAAEILFEKDKSFPDNADKPALAKLYCTALGSNLTGMANPWGLMYYDNSTGVTGGHLLRIGNSAIPFLEHLLADTSAFAVYSGSETATVGNSMEYRIKDVAAWYICALSGIEIQFFREFAERDKEIERILSIVHSGEVSI